MVRVHSFPICIMFVLILTYIGGFTTFESVYGPSALQDQTELTIRSTNGVSSTSAPPFVRMITAAPEIEGVISAIQKLSKRGVVCSIGHRFVNYLSSCWTLYKRWFICCHFTTVSLPLTRPSKPCNLVPASLPTCSTPCHNYITGTRVSSDCWVLPPLIQTDHWMPTVPLHSSLIKVRTCGFSGYRSCLDQCFITRWCNAS